MHTHLEWLRAKIKEYDEFRSTNDAVIVTRGVEDPDSWKECTSWYATEQYAFCVYYTGFY